MSHAPSNAVSFGQTTPTLRNFKKWIKIHDKTERLGGHMCNHKKSEQCSLKFRDRKRKEALRDACGKCLAEKKPHKKVSGLII